MIQDTNPTTFDLGTPEHNPMTGDSWSSSDNPWKSFEQNWRFHFYDNFVNGGWLYQEMAPGESQYSQFSQQMVATMYQNWYNSAPEQMKRAMEAGINPFVAASGISGNGNGSVASAPAPTRTSAVPNLIGSAAQGLSAIGGAFGNVANGIATLAKLRHEIKNIDQNTASAFESMGFTKLQSIALSTQLKFMADREQIAVWQALADFDKTKAEYNNLVANHRNIIAQYDEIIAHKDLLVQEKGEVEARAIYEKALTDKTKAEAEWQGIENQFFTAHGYKLGTPIYEGLRDKMVSDGTFDMESFGNTVADYNGKVSAAVEHVKAVESWNYRPSNAAEAAVYAGSFIGTRLRNYILGSNGVKDWSQLFAKLKTDVAASREFDEAYGNAREDLYEEYLSKKRYYRNIRHSGNSQEVARAKNSMDSAFEEYKTFSREKFGNELIKSISPR